MTTSSEPTPTTTESEDSSSELSRIWRAIGVLQGTVATLVDGQRQLMDGQRQLMESQERSIKELRDEFKADLREVHRRMDRMFFAFIAIGGALLVSAYASRFIGG